jgi:hypothetical protein
MPVNYGGSSGIDGRCLRVDRTILMEVVGEEVA